MHTSLAPGIAGRRHGKGPAMLLIHGVGMRADYWSNIEADLAEHFSLIVVDMPGHGGSPALDEEKPALSLYTDKIATALSQLHQPAIVVGHSMGALIALDFAVRYPSQVSGIAVLNGVYRRSVQAQRAVSARVAQLTASIEEQNDSDTATDSSPTLERWFGMHPTGVQATASDLCRQWLKAADAAGYRDAYSAFANADAPPDQLLRAVTCPALFMTGSLEPNSTPEMSQRMSELVTGAKCVIVNDAKHMMTMTHGSQVVAALVEYFQPENPLSREAHNGPL